MIAGGSKKYNRLIDNCIQARDRDFHYKENV